MSKLKVLVAGASGQVAHSLVLTAPQGAGLTALGRPDLDLTDPVLVHAAVEAIRPDLVINAAAYTAVDQAETDEAAAFRLNAEGAGHLAAAAAGVGAAILHLSTDYVFSGNKTAAYVEEDQTGPTGAYGRSKLAGEQAVAAANPRHFIFRTAWVYSPFGRNFLKTMLRLASVREEVGVVHDQWGNPTSAQDIAGALWQIAGQVCRKDAPPAAGVYHMAGSGEASWAEFAEWIFRASAEAGGPFASVNRIPSSAYPTPAQRPQNSRLDSRRLAETFGIILPQWQASTTSVVNQVIKNKGWEE